MNDAEKFVRYALTIGALELVPDGRKLKSGRISPYFFNSGLFNTGETLTKLAEAYALAGVPERTDVIFGPAYKGISIATAVAMALWKIHKMNVGFAFNRKEVKNHGEGGIIVGHSLAGKNVCIVDDVMTTGTSSEEAVDIIRANGGNPIACIIAFDRQERGSTGQPSAVQKFERNYKIPVRATATLTNLIEILSINVRSAVPTISNCRETLKKINSYRDKYGAVK